MGIPLQDATNKRTEEFRVVEIVRSFNNYSALVWPLWTRKKRDAVEVGAVRVSHPLRHPSLSCRKEWCNFGACFTHDDATPCGLVGASCMRLRRERKMLGILFNVACYKAQDDEAHDLGVGIPEGRTRKTSRRGQWSFIQFQPHHHLGHFFP